MLISFTVENFLSIKDPQSISFIAEPLKELVSENIIVAPLLDLPLKKSVILFGPNGTGKSNMFLAINFITKFLKESSTNLFIFQELKLQPYKFSLETQKQPSRFIIDMFVSKERYRYEITLDKNKIHDEKLYLVLKTKEHVLFERTFEKMESDPKRFPEGVDLFRFLENNKSIQSRVRENTAAISIAALFNGPISNSIIDFLNRIVQFEDNINYTASLLDDSQKKIKIESFLRNAQIGFKRIETEPIPTENNLLDLSVNKAIYKTKQLIPKVEFVYDVKNSTGEIVDEASIDVRSAESRGNRKMFALAGYYVEALEEGKVLIIDEFTAGLHPRLAYHLLKQFHNSISHNQPAQLMVASHNTYLMRKELFRRDQIFLSYFNDGERATKLKTIHQLKARGDISFEKRYFDNELGGIPLFED